MNANSLVRDVTIFAAAAAIGWYAHSANTAVLAQHTSSSSSSRGAGESNLAFQFGGAGLEGALTLYNPETRTLYVYPGAISNSHINCSYMLHVRAAGAPIDRENCTIGSPF